MRRRHSDASETGKDICIRTGEKVRLRVLALHYGTTVSVICRPADMMTDQKGLFGSHCLEGGRRILVR